MSDSRLPQSTPTLRESIARICNRQYDKEITIAEAVNNLESLLSDRIREARIDARGKLLSKLERTYRLIIKPIKESPMELTLEAEQYNRFVEDLYKFIDIERKKNEAASSALREKRKDE